VTKNDVVIINKIATAGKASFLEEKANTAELLSYPMKARVTCSCFFVAHFQKITWGSVINFYMKW
jgi:hypothetical protein